MNFSIRQMFTVRKKPIFDGSAGRILVDPSLHSYTMPIAWGSSRNQHIEF